jgi:hypothetical protein
MFGKGGLTRQPRWPQSSDGFVLRGGTVRAAANKGFTAQSLEPNWAFLSRVDGVLDSCAGRTFVCAQYNLGDNLLSLRDESPSWC